LVDDATADTATVDEDAIGAEGGVGVVDAVG
jgi:hypothetical protein